MNEAIPIRSLIDRLAAMPAYLRGTGDGVESGPFDAEMTIENVEVGLGVELDYIARAPDGSKLHSERAVLAYQMTSGQMTLFVLAAELQGVAQLIERSPGVFDNGVGERGFELRVEIDLVGEDLTYVWSWGAPGEALGERSRAVLRPA
jgi:hypothetical protein